MNSTLVRIVTIIFYLGKSMESYIRDCLKDFIRVIDHHYNIFGIEQELSNNDYLNIKNDIFNLMNLFSFADEEEFNDELTLRFIDDTLALFKYFTTLDVTYNVQQLYLNYDKKNETCKDEFKKKFNQVLKTEKIRAIRVMNTKLFYLDTYMWDKAVKSKAAMKFIRSFGAFNVKNTREFLSEATRPFKSKIKSEFYTKSEALKVSYEQADIDKIKVLKEKTIKSYDPVLEKLIASKGMIKLFKNMADEDIRHVVKNVKFLQCRPHETVVNIGDLSQEIYFILKGTCRVTVGNKNVGVLNTKQIFGEFAPLMKEPRTATVKANEPVTLISFELDLGHFNKDPYSFTHLYKNLTDELIVKIQTANKKRF